MFIYVDNNIDESKSENPSSTNAHKFFNTKNGWCILVFLRKKGRIGKKYDAIFTILLFTWLINAHS